MLDISNPLQGGFVYRMLIPQTEEDRARIAELEKQYRAEIDESQILNIHEGDFETYRVVSSLVHGSESDQLHLCHRIRQ